MAEQDKTSISKLVSGLNLDCNPSEQLEGTYRFALNGVLESLEGEKNIISNEEANSLFAQYKPNFVPLGKTYTTDSSVVILSVSDDNITSEIGILNLQGYRTIVNDSESPEQFKLGFKLENQIDVTYRLRLGCEHTIYWVDGNRPMYFNFSKPNNFKNDRGYWVKQKFYLQKTVSKMPEFTDVNVLDSGGNLEPGSINIAIQLVDEGLNPTEWLNTSPTLKIYNDITSKNYSDIRGSINSQDEAFDFPKTGKSIQVNVRNLDEDYIYYRLAFITSSTGLGLVDSVFVSDLIPISKKDFIYTGTNHVGTATVEEIAMFTSIIEKAKHIEQIDNRLLISNTEGSQIDYCALQKYASKIKVDCVVKKVNLSNINDPSNPKNPSHEFYKSGGYMPGEMYSEGIVYLLENMTTTPVFHIPGKPLEDADVVYSIGDNLYPMSGVNTVSSVYSENSVSCGTTSSYWGLDCSGRPLIGKSIRHHRMPRRKDINVPLVNISTNPESEVKLYQLNLNVKGNLKTPIACDPNDSNCVQQVFDTLPIEVNFKVNGENQTVYINIDPNYFAGNENGLYNLDMDYKSTYFSSNQITDVKISVPDPQGIMVEVPSLCSALPEYFDGNICFSTSVVDYINKNSTRNVEGNILGLKFSGIEKPPKELTGGLEVIGYYIVRNERTDSDKSVLDSAVLFPLVNNAKYLAQGLLQPEISSSKISKNVFGLLHPEHKFKGKEYVQFDSMEQEGVFNKRDVKYSKITYQDVLEGSSYNNKFKAGNDDGRELDGWSIDVITRDTIVDFSPKEGLIVGKDNVSSITYLNALGNTKADNSDLDIWNTASDNKIGIIQTNIDYNIQLQDSIPYVYLLKENADPYSNFRTAPYYKETVNPVYFDDDLESEVSVFNGDIYISPMRYMNSVFWDNTVAKRVAKKSIVTIIVGAILIVAGALLSVFTAGLSSTLVYAGIAILGAGAVMASSGLKQAQFEKAYGQEYAKGLRQTLQDDFVSRFYQYKDTIPFGYTGNGRTGYSGPSDDSIQWVADCISDLWFETTINTHLRNGVVDDATPTFLNCPSKIEEGNISKIETWEFFGTYYTKSSNRETTSELEKHVIRKLTVFDNTMNDNKKYLGLALGEYYNVNPDYYRKNKEKKFYHLAAEYDCCSECSEVFPHRIYYSEQSFQESLTDNYRIFLPNNYRDLDGETGVITNMYKIGDDLFLHTEESLWKVPRSFQERVTDEIVSFIGTGEFFSIPPIKIVDDSTGNSAGCRHKWGTLKFQNAVVFPSIHQNKIYLFDGRLTPISDEGLMYWFNDNMPIKSDEMYFKNNGKQNPYSDNPSNPLGSGYIAAYDSLKQRILFTKKDYIYPTLVNLVDYEIYNKDGNKVVFKNISNIKALKLADGWIYDSVENGSLKFKKDVYNTTTEVVRETVIIPAYTIEHPEERIEESEIIPDCSNIKEFSESGVVESNGAGSGDEWYRWETEYCDGRIESGDVGVGSYTVGASGCVRSTPSVGVNVTETILILNEDPNCYNTVVTIIPAWTEYIPEEIIITEKEITKNTIETIYSYVEGEILNLDEIVNNSWTISYSLRSKSWVSWHSYLPEFYIMMPNKFFSWVSNADGIWLHNTTGKYQTYYNLYNPFIVEYVSSSNPVVTRIFDYVQLITNAKKFHKELNEFSDERFITFNKALFYNSRQCSGILNLIVKDISLLDEDYLLHQVQNLEGDSIVIDRSERDWYINQIRDLRIDYSKPIFNSSIEARQENYYIDKVLNESTIDYNKPWFEQESFRDKYLVIRLIFDNFDDVKLIFNFSVEYESQSPR